MKKWHKALPDDDWIHRLRAFAEAGRWHPEMGNRPAKKQKKWYTRYQEVHVYKRNAKFSMKL